MIVKDIAEFNRRFANNMNILESFPAFDRKFDQFFSYIKDKKNCKSLQYTY